MANQFNIDKGGTTDTHLLNETFHVFSKSPGSPTTSLGGARLKSGHTTTSSDVWSQEIPAFFNAATEEKFNLFQGLASKDDLCLFAGNIYIHDGKVFVSKGAADTFLTDGKVLQKNGNNVIKYHKGRTAINLTADNNNGDGSNNYTAKIYDAAEGSTTFVSQFISSTDKFVGGVPSSGYDAVVKDSTGQLAEGLTNDADYICNAYAGVIQFNKARLQDTVTVSAWEYIGTKLDTTVSSIVKRITDVEAEVGGGTGSGSVTERLETVEKEIDTLQSNVTTINSAVTTNTTNITNLTQTVADNKSAADTAIKAAKDAADAAQDDVDALAGRVTTAEGEIDALQTAVNALESGKLRYQVVHSVDVENKKYVETAGAAAQDCVVNVIYLVSDDTVGAYVEYLCVANSAGAKIVEQIGTTDADLDGYATKATNYAKSSAAGNLVTATVKSSVTDAVTEVAIDDSKLDAELATMVAATKAAKDAADANATAITALQGKMTTAEGDIDGIEDKLEGITGTVADAIATAKTEAINGAKVTISKVANSAITVSPNGQASTAFEIGVNAASTTDAGVTTISGSGAIAATDKGNAAATVTAVAATRGAIDSAITTAQSTANEAKTAAATAQTTANDAVADAAAAQTTANEAKTAATKAQGEVDALETLVGTIPTGSSATTIVAYVDAKASAAQTAATLGAGTNVTITDKKIHVATTDSYASDSTAPANGKAIAAALATMVQTQKTTTNGITYSQANTGKVTVDAQTATTGRYGTTKLYSGTDSTSEVLAATPKAVNTALTSAKAYTDTEIAALSADGGAIKALATRVGTAEGEIDTLQSDVTTLKGAATVAGSVAEAKKAGTDAHAAVTALTNGQVKTNTDAIATLTGTGTGSVAKAVADAKSDIEGQTLKQTGSSTGVTSTTTAGPKVTVSTEGTVGTGITSIGVSLTDVASAKTLSDLSTTVATNKTAAETAAAKALTDAKAHTNTEIGKIDTAYKAADTALDNRIKANEALLDGISGTVTAAIDAAEADAISAAKTYTDTQITALSGAAVKSIGVTDNAAHVTLTSAAVDANGKVQLTLSESDIASAKTLSDLTNTVNTHIADAAKIGIEIAQPVSETDRKPKVTTPSTGKIYLVPATATEGEVGGTYVEWIYTNNAWVRIGTTATDLTKYAKTADVTTAIDAAKTAASNDATSKANQALADAKADATTKANKALEDAKDYTDAEIVKVNSAASTLNTQVTANKNAIDKLNGSATTTGSVAKAVADATATITTAYKAYADQAETDAIASAKTYTDTVKSTLQTAISKATVKGTSGNGLTVTTGTDATTGTIITMSAANGTNKGAVGLSDATNGTSGVSGGIAATPAAVSAALTSAKSYADTAEADALAAAKTYTNDEIGKLDVTESTTNGIKWSQTNGKVSISVSADTTPTAQSAKFVTSGGVKTYVDTAAAKATTKVANSDTEATALGYCRVSSSTGSNGSTTYTVDNDPRITVTKTQLGSPSAVEGDVITGGSVKFVDWSKVEVASSAFASNTSLTKFHADLDRLTTGTSMFSGCTKLTSFCGNLSSLTAGGAEGMFSQCELDEESVIYIIDSLPTVTGGKITIGVASTVTTTMQTAYGKEATAKGWTVTWN